MSSDQLPAYSAVNNQNVVVNDTSSQSGSSSTVNIHGDGISTQLHIGDDGRVDIDISKRDARLVDQLEQIRLNAVQEEPEEPPQYVDGKALAVPPLNIVIQIVGSRGDVQPFVALGQVLKNNYGHRIRLATHGVFKKFVEENGLEFFDIGGDPAELMAFMVNNPSLIPSLRSVKAGDIGKRRKAMAEIIRGCWKSCFENIDEPDLNENIGTMKKAPFMANAIIANPPSFAHIHCAERLGIPLHLMFTMPWSPTRDFPQPIANIRSGGSGPSATNESSYTIVEMMTWQGLGDIINKFRRDVLSLPELSQPAAVTMIERLRVPYTYCWSPALIPKPQDWGQHIDIAGFYFLSLATNYQPPAELAEFLAAGPPPVYIGFGSIVVDDPNAMTDMIFEAVRKTGQRALVSKGWGGIGGDDLETPAGVFMLGNCPHDWLFKHVSCVVHHGGAGTTAAGIALGRPTVIVPFFGDQPFWGAMVARAGAGPEPIPYKKLTAEGLAGAILEAIKPETLQRARELGERIEAERGTEAGAASFHKQIKIDRLRCQLTPNRTAVWRVKTKDGDGDVRLSAFAATVLSEEGILDLNRLKLYQPCKWVPEELMRSANMSRANPVVSLVGTIASDAINTPVELARAWGNVVKKPYKGAKRGGWKGFGLGLKTGVGGILFPRKGLSLTRYTFRALYENIRSKMDSEAVSYALAAHYTEGIEQMKNSTEAERAIVIQRWRELALNLV